MDKPTGVTEARRRSRPVIDWVWRAAVVITLLSQLFTEALRTAWGRQQVGAILSRSGVVDARQFAVFSSGLDPATNRPLYALAGQIRRTVPPNIPVAVVIGEWQLNDFANHLAYELYPRPVSRNYWNAPSTNARQCTIYWRAATDITLLCPDSSWTYQPAEAQP